MREFWPNFLGLAISQSQIYHLLSCLDIVNFKLACTSKAYMCMCPIYRGYYTLGRRYECFMFLWQEQYLTHLLRSLVRYCSCHSNIKYISSSQRVMFFYYMEKPIQQKRKAGIVTSLNDATLTKVTYGKYATRVPDEVVYGIYEWFSSQ